MISRVVVAPLSRDAIEGYACSVRRLLGIGMLDRVDMLRLIELVLPKALADFKYEVVPDRELGHAEATTSTTERHIKISDSLYRAALRQSGSRYPFTLAHEVGHLLLHTGKPASLARGDAKAYVNPEWQADNFAASFLAPKEMVFACRSLSELMQRSGLSRDAAEVRLKVLKISLPMFGFSFKDKGC